MTTKFLLTLQFCRNAANPIFFVLKTIISALMFLKGESTNIKVTFGPPLLLGVQKFQKRLGLSVSLCLREKSGQ